LTMKPKAKPTQGDLRREESKTGILHGGFAPSQLPPASPTEIPEEAVYVYKKIGVNVGQESKLVDLPKIISRIKEILDQRDAEF